MKAAYVRALLLVIVCAGMLVFLRRVDWHATSSYLRQLGTAAPLVLLPYACALCCDTLGWRSSFEHPSRLPFSRLLRLRTATEALSNSLPGGIAVGETLKTVLLTRSFGIPLSDAAANVIVSKFTLAFAHSVFLLCGLWLGASLLTRPGHPSLFGICLAVVCGFVVFLLIALKLVQNSSLSRALERVLRVLPARAGEALARLRAPVLGLDRSLAVIGRIPRAQLAASIACFFLGWLAMGCENWLILSLLTPHATFSTALSMEALVSLVRVAFFFVPAGFGAQDVSYFALLNMSGLPDAQAIATAFMLLKRAKEACWIALGYVLLWLRSTTGARDQQSLAL